MPVGGAARVEPSRVLQDLGPAVKASPDGRAPRPRAVVPPSSIAPPAIPTCCRAMLLGGAAAAAAAAAMIIEDREPAPVVILPVTPTVERDGIARFPRPGPRTTNPGRRGGDRRRHRRPPPWVGPPPPPAGGAGAAAAGRARGQRRRPGVLNRGLENLALAAPPCPARS